MTILGPTMHRLTLVLVLLTLLTLLATACAGTPEDPTATGEEDEAAGADTETADDTDVGDDATGATGATEETTGEVEETTDEAAGEDGPISIGVSLPLTGDFSEPGQGVQNGYELWAANLNAAGGLLGRDVEFEFRDDGSDPNQAVSDYEQLITVEEVDLVFGPFSTRLVVPTSEVAEEFNMLFVEPAGAAPEVFDRGLEYLFYAAPAVADDHYNYLADWILALPDDQRPTTAAYASLDDPFAQGTAYGLRDQLEEAGIETVADEVYPPEQTDFSAVAAVIADADADIVVGGTQFEDSVGLVRAFQELGYQPDLAAFSTGPTLPEFPEAVGDAAEGILSPVGWSVNAEHPSNIEFVETYREMFDNEPSEDSANGYTVGQIVAQAVEAVGCAEPSEECQTALADHIRANEFETVVGPLTFDEAGRPQAAHMIQQWIGGEINIVLPDGSPAQTEELVYPKPPW